MFLKNWLKTLSDSGITTWKEGNIMVHSNNHKVERVYDGNYSSLIDIDKKFGTNLYQVYIEIFPLVLDQAYEDMVNDSLVVTDIIMKMGKGDSEVEKNILKAKDCGKGTGHCRKTLNSATQSSLKSGIDQKSIEILMKTSEYQRALGLVVEKVKFDLDKIATLDTNGYKRIAGIKMMNRHGEAIEAMAISESKKEVLKEAFNSYINLRVSCFQKMEEFAVDVVNDYNCRTLDGSKVPDSAVVEGLMRITRWFKYGVYNVLSVPEEYVIQEMEAKSIIMQEYNNYIRTGSFDRERIDEIPSSLLEGEVTYSVINMDNFVEDKDLDEVMIKSKRLGY